MIYVNVPLCYRVSRRLLVTTLLMRHDVMVRANLLLLMFPRDCEPGDSYEPLHRPLMMNPKTRLDMVNLII